MIYNNLKNSAKKMELSLLTWNVWFDEYQKNHRIKVLFKEIQQHSPDIIALQEITQESLLVLNTLIQETNYQIIGTPLQHRYDTIILSRFPVLNWQRYALPQSQMGRNLLLAEIAFQKTKIHFGTFHLESIFRNNEDEQTKIAQLQFIEAITPQNTILMGDTNFKNTTIPQTSLIDIYEYIERPKAYEYTYSGKTNMHIKNKRMNSRLDRIYLKSQQTITRFYLTGEEKQPSDHYGVFATLKY